MLKTYIPTCNRACQLHALLESIEKNAPNLFDVTVSYKATSESYLEGYKKLMTSPLGSKCEWRPQLQYGSEWMEFVREHRGQNVGHIVDDMIFYRPTVCEEFDINEFLLSEKVFCFNFRVGLNITVTDYVTQKRVCAPSYNVIDDRYLLWDYRNVKGTVWDSYWNFELPVDGYICRADDIWQMCKEEDYRTWTYPGHYEKALCHNGRRDQHGRNLMISPLHSELFSNQVNVSHGLGYRSSNKFNMTPEQLNEKYLRGYKIDLNSMHFSVNSAHDEIPFNVVGVG